MKIDGACHCGYITYTAEIDPEQVGICHCTDCQTFSGSAFRTSVSAARDAFELLGGKPKIYVKTAESGARRAQAFCPECGTAIYRRLRASPRASIYVWARLASELGCGRRGRVGAAQLATGSWICTRYRSLPSRGKANVERPIGWAGLSAAAVWLVSF